MPRPAKQLKHSMREHKPVSLLEKKILHSAKIQKHIFSLCYV